MPALLKPWHTLRDRRPIDRLQLSVLPLRVPAGNAGIGSERSLARRLLGLESWVGGGLPVRITAGALGSVRLGFEWVMGGRAAELGN
jgi:hypothetical protein